MPQKSRTDSPASGEKNQLERLIETARAIGADEDEAAFKAKLAVIARQKPKESANCVDPKPKKG